MLRRASGRKGGKKEEGRGCVNGLDLSSRGAALLRSVSHTSSPRALLLLHDELVLLAGRLGLEALPGEAALKEVDEDIPDGLEVIAPGLFDAQMIVNRGVTRCTREGSALAGRNVLEGTGVPISL